MPPLASAKSVAVVKLDAVLIIRCRTRNTVTIAQPLQQISVLAALATKGRKLQRNGLLAQRAFRACGFMR